MTEHYRLPSVSAIVPVYNGRTYLERSLPPLIALLGKELLEVIVVDDSSTDGSRELAEQMGARVIPSGGRLGPAGGRNLGAREARGEVLLLVDVDVGLHPDAVGKVRSAFAAGDMAAAFGSYDDRPSHPGFWSQYKNLLHHHTHQSAAREASTFWTGCSAVRKEALLSAGGFDAALYAHPSIEDIEFGYRLRAAGGKIKVLHDVQGTHFKHWTLAQLLHTDIFRRAIPWSKLILSSPQSRPDLNVRPGEMARAALATAFFLILFLAFAGAVPLWTPAIPLFAGFLANASLFSLFHRCNGLLFAVGALLFHQVYYVYSGAAFLWCYLAHWLRSAQRVK